MLLAQQLEALKSEEDFDLNVVGYSDDELETLLADLSDELVGGEVDPDDLDDTGANGDKGDGLELIADVVRAEPKTKVEPGDVFKLGQHTLICCDVLKEWETYAPLMKPGYVFLPYPSPLIPLAATDKICVLVQPDTYLAAMTCDLFEAAHPGEKAHKL